MALRLPGIRYLAETELVADKAIGPESGIKGLGIAPGTLPSHVPIREERVKACHPTVLVGQSVNRLHYIGRDALVGIERGQLVGAGNFSVRRFACSPTRAR